MVNRLLNYVVWQRERQFICASRAPTQWHALRRRRGSFLLKVFMALVLTREKDGTLCLVSLWAER